jgi:hypothetical protein
MVAQIHETRQLIGELLPYPETEANRRSSQMQRNAFPSLLRFSATLGAAADYMNQQSY